MKRTEHGGGEDVHPVAGLLRVAPQLRRHVARGAAETRRAAVGVGLGREQQVHALQGQAGRPRGPTPRPHPAAAEARHLEHTRGGEEDGLWPQVAMGDGGVALVEVVDSADQVERPAAGLTLAGQPPGLLGLLGAVEGAEASESHELHHNQA